jgi:alpha-L-fucosidase
MLDVPIWQYVLSQGFGLVQIVITILALQAKSKTKTLLLYTLANVMAVASNAFLFNYIIVATKSVSIFKNLAFAYIDKNRKQLRQSIKIGVLLFFLAAAVGAVMLTKPGPLDYVILAALMFSYYAEWAEGVHILRAGLAVYTVAVLINAIVFFNIAGVVMCLITFAGVGLFYLRLLKRNKGEGVYMINEKIENYLKKIDDVITNGKYKDNWESLANYPVPKWFVDGKLGIFIHWGVYSVPEFHSEWYSRFMYKKLHRCNFYHHKHYGDPKEVGYRELIPHFTAPNFDPQKWADAIAACGAKYVIPVAEHHDGFKMYSSELSKWNAKEMGPKRDVIAEVADAVRQKGLRLGVSNHRAEHSWFMNGMREIGIEGIDEPENADFYGACTTSKHGMFEFHSIDPPNEDWCKDWLATACELVDLHKPSSMYFDFGIKRPLYKPYLKKFAAYYYNRALEWGKEVAIFYKYGAYQVGTAIFDVERGSFAGIYHTPFQTCTAIADNSWSYTVGNKFKSSVALAQMFVDIISKNGCLLLNVGPRAAGEFCDEELAVLQELGKFTGNNAEAIYESRPYKIFGEGKVKIKDGGFKESAKRYTHKDFRFTVRAGAVYAFAMKQHKRGEYFINSIIEDKTGIVKNVKLLGFDNLVDYTVTPKGLKIKVHEKVDTNMPICFKIELE